MTKLLRKRSALPQLQGRDSGNFEDYIRVANELLRGLEIISQTKADDAPEREPVLALQNGLAHALKSFSGSIMEVERSLVLATAEDRDQAFNYLVSFLMSFASRSGTRERLQLFTTNYDRYIEAGADAAGLRLIDRFVGTLAPVFRASRLDVDLHYNRPASVASRAILRVWRISLSYMVRLTGWTAKGRFSGLVSRLELRMPRHTSRLRRSNAPIQRGL